MTAVLLDTNIIMDALQERYPFDAAAKEIMLSGQNGAFTCLFTANAASDIFFLYSRARNSRSARSALSFLLTHYGVVSVTQDDCINALAAGVADFEDALVLVCAKQSEVDYIVTRDKEFLLQDSPIPLISPEKFLEKIRNVS